jgi:hypothetical protein
MNIGDLDLAMRAVRRAGRPKTLVLLSDLYSPRAKAAAVVNPMSIRETRAVLERGRGNLSTLLIIDAQGATR